MKITAFPVVSDPLPIKRATVDRQWMDDTPERFAYRCLPLNIANQAGWKFTLDDDIVISWNGGPRTEDIQIYQSKNRFTSHFGAGIVTFHTGYIFKTYDDWSLWVRGVPNDIKDCIQPLDGIVETNWAPFTFTMNWKFTQPSKIKFPKGSDICFVTPIHLSTLENFDVEIDNIDNFPEFRDDYLAWSKSRSDFIKMRKETGYNGPGQRFYIRGEDSEKEKIAPDTHKTKLKLKEFK